MATADELRAKAKQLYKQAERTKDGEERLVYFLQARSLEMDAEAQERDKPGTEK